MREDGCNRLIDSTAFLSQPNNYTAMINVDWFQPFKRKRDYSVGVIYLVLLNLPKSIRFHIENVCILGIIPALVKEPESLNSYYVLLLQN